MRRTTLFKNVFAFAAMLLAASCTQQPKTGGSGIALDGLLSFTSPAECSPGPALEMLIKSLLKDTTIDPPEAGPPVLPSRFRVASGRLRVRRRGNLYTATLPLSGSWMGLRVAQLGVEGWRGGDGAGYFIAFDEPRAIVLTRLNASGFSLPEHGFRPLSSDVDASDSRMGVVRQGSRSIFRCDP